MNTGNVFWDKLFLIYGQLLLGFQSSSLLDSLVVVGGVGRWEAVFLELQFGIRASEVM